MTEEEAKTKWCPEARVFDSDGGSAAGANRKLGYDWASRTNCIASDCMMWRWEFDEYQIVGDNGEQKSLTMGFCGKGGKL